MSLVKRNSRSSQKGFSLVELMVAILIGLIILAGVIQVVVTSKATFLNQEDMAYIQENARYAVRTITSDIQNAGHWGCAGSNPVAALVGTVNAGAIAAQLMFSSTNPIESFNGLFAADDLWDPTNYTGDHVKEYFVVRRAGGTVHSLDSHSGTNIELLQSAQDDWSEGDYVAVIAEDCRRMGVVQLSSVNGNTLSVSSCTGSIKPDGLSYTCDDAATAPPPKAYLPGTTVMEYIAHAYYIEESSVLTGQPALKRRALKAGNSINTEEQEIALGVEDMQLLYGVQQADGQLRFYSQTQIFSNGSGIDWSDVSSVRLSLVFRSQTETAGVANAAARTHLGVTYNDGYIRKTVTTTVQLRNRT